MREGEEPHLPCLVNKGKEGFSSSKSQGGGGLSDSESVQAGEGKEDSLNRRLISKTS